MLDKQWSLGSQKREWKTFGNGKAIVMLIISTAAGATATSPHRYELGRRVHLRPKAVNANLVSQQQNAATRSGSLQLLKSDDIRLDLSVAVLGRPYIEDNSGDLVDRRNQ